MPCPKDKFGLFIPEYPILENGTLPKNRQLFLVDKKHFTKEEAWDIAYDNNIHRRRYVLWRILKEEKFAIKTLLLHRYYWYFECALLGLNQQYKLKSY